ncbi:MAG: hypothetical protein MUD14_10125 [Hydrococcus sp. Prado102]|jgi:hypothetical protein|nr:hypothetical protein [Hydrococcus sp. Prado102]
MEPHDLINLIGDRAVENVLTGNNEPNLEILRLIAEDKASEPAIRYLAACCRKFQLDAYKRESNEMHEREIAEYE